MANNQAQDALRTYENYYAPTLKRLTGLQHTAGVMLAAAYGESEDPATCRKIAEEMAQEAASLVPELKAWRLANGYEA